MANIDKNDVMTKFLFTCPKVLANELFFNFAEAKKGTVQYITRSNDTSLNKPYIDGSEDKQFTFALLVYKQISQVPMVNDTTHIDANLADVSDIQGLMDWVKEQSDSRVFPDFGDDCIIESMELTTENPKLEAIEDKSTPNIACYSMEIIVKYLDKSKKIWDN